MPTARRTLVATGGFDDAQLTAMIRSGVLVTPFRGVVGPQEVSRSPMARFAAALACQDITAALGHRSAAVASRLRWVPESWREADAVVDVVVPRTDARRHRSGLRLHRALLDPADVTVIDGLRCTSVARTLADLARNRREPRLLVVQILDGALRDGLVTEDQLQSTVDRLAGLRGVVRARQLIAFGRNGVDSPKETELRLALLDGGVPHVDVDIRITDRDGVLLARGDIGERDLLLWGEYDGYDVHSQRDVFNSDRRGDRWLERRGWHVMRFTNDDLQRPWRLVSEWLTARAAAPARIAAMRPDRSPEVAAARRALGLDR
ncbi:MAG TPA: hypothetical protein VG708_06360 [Mycobacteriales bacterium]|nr:hypothetical protein [Mycobacteriales bacterium]